MEQTSIFDPNKRVILSALLPAVGGIVLYKLTDEQARRWVAMGDLTNYVQHETVRIVGVEPAAERLECPPDWGQALVIRSPHRLEPRREYSQAEFEAMGYEIWLAIRFTGFWWGYEGVADVIPVTRDDIEYPPSVPKEGKLWAGPGEIDLGEFLGYPPRPSRGWQKAFTIKPDGSIE
jgi:hypothetical protein